MAPSNRFEGPAEVQFRGRTLANATSATLEVASGAAPVRTMKGGLVGRARGAPESSVRVSNAIPKAGLEADFIAACVEDEDVRITILVGGKRVQVDGWIDRVTAEFATGSAAGASFVVLGGQPSVR